MPRLRHRHSTSRSQDNLGSCSGIERAVAVAALMLTLLLEALDQTVVGTVMPRIIAQFHGLDRYTWVVTAYLLASTVAIPLVGKLSDLHGRKR